MINKKETLSPAEKKIRKMEVKISEIKTQMAALRRKLPKKEVSDYVFKNNKNKTVKLSELFGNKNELILIHNMGKACVYCTLWADGFNGISGHLENRAAFAVVSPDDVKIQNEFAKSRGWKFGLHSSKDTAFKKDMGFEPEPGDFEPGVSVFTKDRSGKIFHHTKARFGPGDNYAILWDLLDLLPSDAPWSPKYSYKTN